MIGCHPNTAGQPKTANPFFPGFKLRKPWFFPYHEQFFSAPYRMKLFPLGNPDTDKELDKMSDEEKHQTILLLDAFDEDIRAVEDYRVRLQELILKTRHFREIVITCRTQFFPSEEEEPKETGVMRYGTEGGEHIFYKFYLSPFDEQEGRTYFFSRVSGVSGAPSPKTPPDREVVTPVCRYRSFRNRSTPLSCHVRL